MKYGMSVYPEEPKSSRAKQFMMGFTIGIVVVIVVFTAYCLRRAEFNYWHEKAHKESKR
jgi:hypothetical protein